MGRWCEAHREQVGRPKIRHARRRRRGRGRRRSCPGESGHGRLRQRVGRRVGGREERVAAVHRLISLAVGPAAGGLGLLAAPRAAGQTEAEDEARDEERRYETQGDLGGLAHVAAHWKKLMFCSALLLLLPC
jgi:hypothetical protein